MSDGDVFPPEVAAKLLRDEYPDDMAKASCTCEPDAMCGAHRLLKRYDEMWHQMRADHERRRKQANELQAEVERLRIAETALRKLAQRVTMRANCPLCPGGASFHGPDCLFWPAVEYAAAAAVPTGNEHDDEIPLWDSFWL